MNDVATDSQKVFTETMGVYKQMLDDDIAVYSQTIRQSTIKNYGEAALVAVEPYCAILESGGKRIRGVLTLVGYDMMNGTNKSMILEAARSVEMMQAYILAIDDIQDRSEVRRSIPTAHKAAERIHQDNAWRGDSAHFGISMALNGALIGSHAANVILANLNAPEELRIKALSIMNHTMMVTAQGQTHDILNEVVNDPVTEQSIDNVLQWKTAHYTVLNPIHMGMVLAGAPCEDTNAITQYALNIGKAFQLTDDLLIMSPDAETGKSAYDDIREGKQTLLTAYVFEHGTDVQQADLRAILGTDVVTSEELAAVRTIFDESGAAYYVRERAEHHIATALTSLNDHRDRWNPDSVVFLEGLATYLINRKS